MKSFNELLESAKKLSKCRIAVAQAANETVLEAVKIAQGEGLIEPVLVGEPEGIRRAADAVHLDLAEHMVIPAGPAEVARTTVQLVARGEADLLMKGHNPEA